MRTAETDIRRQRTQRYSTACLAILFIVGGLLFLPVAWYALVVTALIVAGLFEFYTLIEKKGIFLYKYFGIIVGAIIPISIYFRFEPTKGWELFFITAATLLFFVLQFLRRDSAQAIVGIATVMFGIFYISWFFSFLIKIRLLPAGALLAAFVLLVTKIGDIGAYLVGMRWGKHALITRISPRKTVEGSLGGLAFSIGAALLSTVYLPFIPRMHLLSLGILLGVFSQVGDLCESLIKRDCGVKDSGGWFPGLGGTLDIIDSVIFNGPIFYFYILYFNLLPQGAGV